MNDEACNTLITPTQLREAFSILGLAPPSYERAFAIINMETAAMWYGRAAVCNDPDSAVDPDRRDAVAGFARGEHVAEAAKWFRKAADDYTMTAVSARPLADTAKKNRPKIPTRPAFALPVPVAPPKEKTMFKSDISQRIAVLHAFTQLHLLLADAGVPSLTAASFLADLRANGTSGAQITAFLTWIEQNLPQILAAVTSILSFLSAIGA